MSELDMSSAAQERVKKSVHERARVRSLVKAGNWRAAEPSPTRARAYDFARAAKAGAEAIQGEFDDLQQVAFLVEGARVRRAVGYVEVNTGRVSKTGTGFLIAPGLFLTNQHVIADADEARGAQVTFDRETLALGRLAKVSTYFLDPEAFSLFSAEADLDYALVAVGSRSGGETDLAELGFCPLSNTPDRHRVGMNVNIIQHPNGFPKMIAIRNNLLTYRTDRTLLYETDTDHGSSGAPVFNDQWEVIALHHWSTPYLELKDEHGVDIPNHVNEGVRISAIYASLQKQAASLAGAQKKRLDDALARAVVPSTCGRMLGPPRPQGNESDAESRVRAPERSRSDAMDNRQSTTITVPLEITIRVGAAFGASLEGAAPASEPRPAASKTLTPGAEVLRVDADYEERKGYDPRFLDDSILDLPKPNTALAKLVAPLRPGEKEAAKGVLRYEHFSVVMNKAKRLAMFTATNIDGEAYLSVDRDTGKVVEGAEGDKWFKDPRISESFWTGQDFYSAWSHLFDRGHLTRRTDPTWGTSEEAERANADTFHWTNCSPQHFRFNETTPFWQGAERYVLENGVLAQNKPKRLVVFQGPVFDSKVDRYADDLQLPSSFFKVIVWPGEDKLKAVGLVVDQLALLGEERRSLGQPRDVPSVDVRQWRVGIKAISKRTGLSFGTLVEDADTISRRDQPDVGAEAAFPLRSFEDLLRPLA